MARIGTDRPPGRSNPSEVSDHCKNLWPGHRNNKLSSKEWVVERPQWLPSGDSSRSFLRLCWGMGLALSMTSQSITKSFMGPKRTHTENTLGQVHSLLTISSQLFVKCHTKIINCRQCWPQKPVMGTQESQFRGWVKTSLAGGVGRPGLRRTVCGLLSGNN